MQTEEQNNNHIPTQVVTEQLDPSDMQKLVQFFQLLIEIDNSIVDEQDYENSLRNPNSTSQTE